MGVYRVEVEVATARPPQAHAKAYYEIEADGRTPGRCDAGCVRGDGLANRGG